MENKQLSKNFRESEFACSRHGIVHAPMFPILIDILQGVRDIVGRPMIITSGSRCEDLQKSLLAGGLGTAPAITSPHVARPVRGEYFSLTADVAAFMTGVDPEFLQEASRNKIREVHRRCRIGWRKYKRRLFLHVDLAYLVDEDYKRDNGVDGNWVAGVEW